MNFEVTWDLFANNQTEARARIFAMADVLERKGYIVCAGSLSDEYDETFAYELLVFPDASFHDAVEISLVRGPIGWWHGAGESRAPRALAMAVKNAIQRTRNVPLRLSPESSPRVIEIVPKRRAKADGAANTPQPGP